MADLSVEIHANPDAVQVTEQSIQLSFASVVSSDCGCIFVCGV